MLEEAFTLNQDSPNQLVKRIQAVIAGEVGPPVGSVQCLSGDMATSPPVVAKDRYLVGRHLLPVSPQPHERKDSL